jgi:hypothetical protein
VCPGDWRKLAASRTARGASLCVARLGAARRFARTGLGGARVCAMVLPAWQRLTGDYGPPGAVGSLYGSFTGSWIVYASWPLAAIVLALVVVRCRDV